METSHLFTHDIPGGKHTPTGTENGSTERDNPQECSHLWSIRRAGNHPDALEGRIAQKANASEKVAGYADVSTVIWKKERRVVWQTRRHPRTSNHLTLRVKVGASYPGVS